MRTMIKNAIVNKDLAQIYETDFINWNEFKNKTIFITGATGGIGSLLIRSLLFADEKCNLNLRVIGLVRNVQKAKNFFDNLTKNKHFKLVIGDVTKEIKCNKKIDYIIHCANNTSSRSFVEKPVETMEVAFCGTKNVLDFAKNKNVKSFVFLSSMEVYGFIDDENKKLSEKDLGSLELLNVRNSYPMGKRAAETLCLSYFNEKKVPVKIARLAQTVGANVNYDDSRVYAQFARSIVEKKDIVLNTTGNTIRSYCYITDVVTGILLLLQKGQNGESYNIANEQATSRIKDIAEMLVNKYPNSELVFNIGDTSIFPKETVWALNTEKIKALGWKADVSLEKMFTNLINSFYRQKDFCNKNFSAKKERAILKKIFSITNYNIDHKQIYILGIKIRIKKRLAYFQYANLPIQKNKIVFSNFNGKSYGCNPKYILEEIIKRKLPYELCWLVNNIQKEKVNFPINVKLIDINSKEAIKELATAKIWIDNQRKIPLIKKGLKKKQEQIYIQTWHGSLGIKRLDNDVKAFNNETNKCWVSQAKTDSNMADYLLTHSKFETSILPKALWFNNNVLEIGHPRNDIFFKNELEKKQIRAKVLNFLGINNAKKILLYIPSFRDDYRMDCYSLDINALINSLKQNFKGDWAIAIRLHPRVTSYSTELFKFSENVINVSFYPDIQELLVAADVAITDFSSCIFDFMLSKKPAFIFATDIDDFNTTRGFYYPLETTPFPIAKNNQELAYNILNFDNEKYIQDVEKFLIDKGCIEDGHASERVVELIQKEIAK